MELLLTNTQVLCVMRQYPTHALFCFASFGHLTLLDLPTLRDYTSCCPYDCCNVAGIYTSGRGSSAVGLTALLDCLMLHVLLLQCRRHLHQRQGQQRGGPHRIA
jgi:hypothetical protein